MYMCACVMYVKRERELILGWWGAIQPQADVSGANRLDHEAEEIVTTGFIEKEGGVHELWCLKLLNHIPLDIYASFFME